MCIIHPHMAYVDGAHWFVKALIETYVILMIAVAINNKKWRDVFLVLTVIVAIVTSLNLLGKAPQLGKHYMALMLGYYISKWNDYIVAKVMSILLLCVYAYMTPICLLLTTIFVVAIKAEKCPYISAIFGNKFMAALGIYSYSWYLIHQNIGYSIQYHILPHGTISIFWVLIPMTITFLLSIFIARIIVMLPKRIVI